MVDMCCLQDVKTRTMTNFIDVYDGLGSPDIYCIMYNCMHVLCSKLDKFSIYYIFMTSDVQRSL